MFNKICFKLLQCFESNSLSFIDVLDDLVIVLIKSLTNVFKKSYLTAVSLKKNELNLNNANNRLI